LQRSAGNRAVTQVLEIEGGKRPPTGNIHKEKRLGLQTKLKVNKPGDIYEQEADRIADQVMATPAPPAVSGAPSRIQRFEGQSSAQAEAAPASVNQALASPGRPLEPELRQDMEQRFGYNFSRVRVHSGATAEQSAYDVNANAYTVGHNIVFGASRFAPGTNEGQRLIAHELTHVIQQSGADGIRAGQSSGKRGLSPISQRLWLKSLSLPMVHRDKKPGDRRVFIEEGFTGRETEEEARLIAASKGWVVEGALRWNGKNWIGENVRKGTGKERAVAQVRVNLMGLENLGGDFPTSEDLAEGFPEGPSIYTGEEPTYTRKFGQGESEEFGTAEKGDGTETGKEGETGSEEKAEGTEGIGTGTGTNELDTLTALASMVIDPGSLAETKKNTTGEQGVPVGSKSGFITGGLAKVLTVLAAALSFLTGPIMKLLGKIKNLGKRALSSLADKLRRLRGASPPSRQLPPGQAAPVRPPSPNRVNPNVPAPQVPPDSLFGRSFQDFGRDVIRWGTGPQGARARMQAITRQELTQAGVTHVQAQAARDFYAGVLARNPGNAAAGARVQLMDRILQLLGG
jgi:hypothetical protein